MFSYLLYCQTSTSAVLHLQSVMSMPTARILLVLIFAPVKLDTVEMEKPAEVDKRAFLLNHEVCDNVLDTSEPFYRQSLPSSAK